jgi:hypothetical protein
MASERIIYLYYPLALYTGLMGHDEGFPTKAVLNPRENERANFIIFNKLIEAADTSFR